MSLVYLKTESIILIRADKKKTNRNDLLPGGGVAQPMFRWRVKRGVGVSSRHSNADPVYENISRKY